MKLLHKMITKLKKANINLIVALSAVLLSACALFISVQEVRIMRVQQKATMLPYVTIGKSYNSKGFGIVLKNSGNGLAKINSYQIYNDSTYFNNWEDVLKALAPDAKIDYSMIRTAGNIRNEMITPNEEVNLIFLNWNKETRLFEKYIENLKIRICYSSLLEEHWVVTDSKSIQLVDACKLEAGKEFGL